MQTSTKTAPRAAKTSTANGASKNGAAKNGGAQDASTRAAKSQSQNGKAARNAKAPQPPSQPYRVSVEEYIRYRRDGFLVVPQLVSPAEIAELRRHTEDLMQGKLPEQQRVMGEDEAAQQTDRLDAPPPHLSPDEKAQFFLRIHMLHRVLELHERYLLHPRVLDVLEALHRPRRDGDANHAVPEAAGKARSGLASGFVLHSDGARHVDRRLDRDRRLRRTKRRNVDGAGQPSRADLSADFRLRFRHRCR